MNAVLPFLYVLQEATEKYVGNEDRMVSQELPNPEHQLRCLPEQQLQPVSKINDSL